MSIKRFLTFYTLQVGLMLFVIGIVLLLFGIFGVFLIDQTPDFLVGAINLIGDWKYWCVLIGPILIIAGGWYFFDNMRRRREFQDLMETASKAKFIRNLDRVEYLAWKLTPKHQSLLAKKKRKFNIK